MTESDFEIFEAVGALVVVLAADGRIVHWNRGCSSLTGYTLQEVRGRKLWDFLLVPEEAAAVEAAFATLHTAERPADFANHWVTRTGERRWIAWSHTLTTNPDGGIQYIIKTGIDRTERKRAEDALRASEARLAGLAAENARLYDSARRSADDLLEANQHMVGATIRAQQLTETAETARARAEESERELRAVAEFREMFLGIVGHDLRNPLGTIAMTAEGLLLRGRLDEVDREGVGRIKVCRERMTRMIVELLDFTRARLGGGFPLAPKPTDLRAVCRTVVDELDATIRLEVEGDVTGTWDPERLAEALSNIVGNAVEHATPGTAITVRARPDGGDVVVEVINRGEPIPAYLLPSIFEPFHREKREKSASGNLGLGLYIARQIVMAAGGTIDARSGGGTTTFVVRLPRHSLAATLSASHAEERA